jgi:hypothetical protein
MLQGHRKIAQRCNTNSGAQPCEDSSQLAPYEASNAVLLTQSSAVKGVKSFRGLEAYSLVTATITELSQLIFLFGPNNHEGQHKMPHRKKTFKGSKPEYAFPH